MEIKGIKWKPGQVKVFWSENLRLCWEYMRKAKTTLGGVNYTGVHLCIVLHFLRVVCLQTS